MLRQFIISLCFFIFSSYLIGYLTRLVPPRLLDRLTIPLASVGTDFTTKNAWKNFNAKQKMMPYDFLYKDQSTKLQRLLDGSEDFSNASDYFRPFFLCKRLILQYSPQLWIDAERREAEIRMINGLFYVTLSMATVFLIQGAFSLFFVSIFLASLLAIAFRRRKYAETSFTYSATFVILKDLEMKNKRQLTSGSPL
jgi:hypothetical protein